LIRLIDCLMLSESLRMRILGNSKDLVDKTTFRRHLSELVDLMLTIKREKELKDLKGWQLER